MPVIRSAKKKLRGDRKRRSANKKIETLVRSSIKNAEKQLTPKNIQEAFSIIDKSVKKNIIHKNKASRIKSRLSVLLNKKTKTPKSKTLNPTKPKPDVTKTESHPSKPRNT